ncbi:MAG: hypothetical protein Q9168_002930 [Polycauliona sp. 1 TL-2023]
MPDPIKVPKFRFEGQAAKLRKVVGHYPPDEDYKKMQRLAEVKAEEFWEALDNLFKKNDLQKLKRKTETDTHVVGSFSGHFVPSPVKQAILDIELCKLWLEAVPTWNRSTVLHCVRNLNEVMEEERKEHDSYERLKTRHEAELEQHKKFWASETILVSSESDDEISSSG